MTSTSPINISLGELAYRIVHPQGDFRAETSSSKREWEKAATHVVEEWHKQAIKPEHGRSDWGMHLFAGRYLIRSEGEKHWLEEYGAVRQRYAIAARRVINAVAKKILMQQESRICGEGRVESLYNETVVRITP